MAIQSAIDFAYEVFLAWRGKPDKEAVALVTARDAAIRAAAINEAMEYLKGWNRIPPEAIADLRARASSTQPAPAKDVAWWQDQPGYPWLPCPICKGVEGCDHTVPERARASSAAKRRQS